MDTYEGCLSKIERLEHEVNELFEESNLLSKISQDADESDEKAIFHMDLIITIPKILLNGQKCLFIYARFRDFALQRASEEI